MYLSEDLRKEIEYFKKINANFTINIGKENKLIKDIDEEKILYILMSASYVMDIFEEGFFENLVITDKILTGKDDFQLDAYAFIETEETNKKHLHLFQYKLYDNEAHGASPKEVYNFASIMNELFVNPELRGDNELNNKVFIEINSKICDFINKKRGNRIQVKCHFITNSFGIGKSNKELFDALLGRFDYDKKNYGFDIEIYGDKNILELIKNGKISIDKEVINFYIGGQNSYRLEDNSKKAGLGLPMKVFIGICNTNELIRLQSKYHHNQLYSENIRLYIGDRSIVNKDIIDTVTSDKSIWFSYMNNGISIICDDMCLLSPNLKDGILPVELKNIQIINGCQTVNALFSAKFSEKTKDQFKPTNILVKIYQIDPSNIIFKQNVIKANNSQNAVGTYSLRSNDLIQIKIQESLNNIGYLYNRKGEARTEKNGKIIDMVNAALAYLATYMFKAQELRAKIGRSRVFQTDYYDNIYKEEYLEDDNEKLLYTLASKLLAAQLIMDGVRIYVKEYANPVKLPIIYKSTYYLCGLFYALNNKICDEFIDNCAKLIEEKNNKKVKGLPIFENFKKNINDGLPNAIAKLTKIYNESNDEDKIDIDNLLKSKSFYKCYLEIPEIKNLKLEDESDVQL
jgi:hypothetical protein